MVILGIPTGCGGKVMTRNNPRKIVWRSHKEQNFIFLSWSIQFLFLGDFAFFKQRQFERQWNPYNNCHSQHQFLLHLKFSSGHILCLKSPACEMLHEHGMKTQNFFITQNNLQTFVRKVQMEIPKWVQPLIFASFKLKNNCLLCVFFFHFVFSFQIDEVSFWNQYWLRSTVHLGEVGQSHIRNQEIFGKKMNTTSRKKFLNKPF